MGVSVTSPSGFTPSKRSGATGYGNKFPFEPESIFMLMSGLLVGVGVGVKGEGVGLKTLGSGVGVGSRGRGGALVGMGS